MSEGRRGLKDAWKATRERVLSQNDGKRPKLPKPEKFREELITALREAVTEAVNRAVQADPSPQRIIREVVEKNGDNGLRYNFAQFVTKYGDAYSIVRALEDGKSQDLEADLIGRRRHFKDYVYRILATAVVVFLVSLIFHLTGITPVSIK